MSASGLGTLWVQCPISTANKVARMKSIRVGWANARVELLSPRALQCYRCLEKGHVQTQCTSSIVRSNLCYRCGQEGHQVKFCTNKPHCVTASRQDKRSLTRWEVLLVKPLKTWKKT